MAWYKHLKYSTGRVNNKLIAYDAVSPYGYTKA